MRVQHVMPVTLKGGDRSCLEDGVGEIKPSRAMFSGPFFTFIQIQPRTERLHRQGN